MLLEVTGLHAGYGDSEVIRGVDLRVDAGQVLTVLGPNGAGKTTLFRALCGVIGSRGDAVRFLGATTRGLGAADLARRGLVMVPEGRHVFPSLTVLDNLRVAARNRAKADISVDAALGVFPQLAQLRHRKAGALSGGQQQMVAIARGLALSPRVLLIDECTMGLAPIVVEQMVTTLGEIASRFGLGLVVADQSLALAGRIGERILLLAGGRVVKSGSTENLDAIAAAYFGTSMPGGV